MLPFILCNKKSLVIRHMNRPLLPKTLSIQSHNIKKLVSLGTYQFFLIILTPILVLSSHLYLCLPSILLPSRFPTKTQYILRPSHKFHIPTHLIFLNSNTRTKFCELYRSLSSSLCISHHFLVTTSLLIQSILLSTLF